MLLGCHCSSIRFILTIVSTPWWHYVIYYWYFYPVGFWSSDHLSRVDRDSLSLFSDFLPFHLAHLSFAYLPIERCAFLYAFIIDAPMSFPYLFFRSLIEVHRSSSTTHALFFPVFIHRILLHLGLDKFSASEPVYIIAPIGATFLR